MLAQPALDVGALHARAAPVNQPHLRKAGVTRRVQVVLDHRPDVARCKRVQIDRVLDGNPNRFIGGISQIFGPVITCFCQWS